MYDKDDEGDEREIDADRKDRRQIVSIIPAVGWRVVTRSGSESDEVHVSNLVAFALVREKGEDQILGVPNWDVDEDGFLFPWHIHGFIDYLAPGEEVEEWHRKAAKEKREQGQKDFEEIRSGSRKAKLQEELDIDKRTLEVLMQEPASDERERAVRSVRDDIRDGKEKIQKLDAQATDRASITGYSDLIKEAKQRVLSEVQKQ
ncbi:MAG TPA: hypothetical protein VGL03_10105 [Thermoanaerobaculia bacterium]|jgi:hypothetical protein